MTRAETLRAYLGLTYEKAPWLYREHENHETLHILTAPDPLGDKPEALAWLGALVGWSHFGKLESHWSDESGPYFRACSDGYPMRTPDGRGISPVHAIIAAMRAADPAFDAAMERADG